MTSSPTKKRNRILTETYRLLEEIGIHTDCVTHFSPYKNSAILHYVNKYTGIEWFAFLHFIDGCFRLVEETPITA